MYSHGGHAKQPSRAVSAGIQSGSGVSPLIHSQRRLAADSSLPAASRRCHSAGPRPSRPFQKQSAARRRCHSGISGETPLPLWRCHRDQDSPSSQGFSLGCPVARRWRRGSIRLPRPHDRGGGRSRVAAASRRWGNESAARRRCHSGGAIATVTAGCRGRNGLWAGLGRRCEGRRLRRWWRVRRGRSRYRAGR